MKMITESGAPTMSSREIADLCNKRHDNVMADIKKMLSDLDLHAPDFSGTYKTGRGNEYECFNLPKRETLILVSGYKLELRARIIDRWQELEARPLLPELSRMDILQMAVDAEKEKLAYKQELEVAAPKLRAHNRLAETRGAYCLTDAAKHLQIAPKELIGWLREREWIYKRTGSDKWVAYQSKQKPGYLIHKTYIYGTDDLGEPRKSDQVLVTPKGLARIAEIMAEEAIESNIVQFRQGRGPLDAPPL